MKFENLKDQKFNRLTAIERVENDKLGHTMWKCKCECNNIVVCSASSLKNGKTKSCGCYKNELVGNRNRKHNMAKTKIYMIWGTIMKRCYNPNEIGYKRYGGRGITVCDEWSNKENGSTNFINWAMDNGYIEEILPNGRNKWTLDRINVNGNYEPSNCRFITMKEQNNNRRTNHYIAYNGKTHTLAEWSEILNIKYGTLKSRLSDYGWSIERAFTEPVINYKENQRSIRL